GLDHSADMERPEAEVSETPSSTIAPEPITEPAPQAESIPRAVEAPAAPAPLPWAPRLPAFVRQWFMGGNTLVRAGVVILFFGIAFLLKYAYEHTHVPLEVRLVGVALGAIALLTLGWRLRIKRAGYALALQGG